MKVIALVQARMGSSRLPGKVMQDLAGKPMVQHVLERVSGAEHVDNIALVTTTVADDDVLADFVRGIGFDVFRGSEDDVLDRYFQAAQAFRADVIVRITADCPLMDPAVIDRSVVEFLDGTFDHVSTAYPVPSYPDGLDVWVFSYSALGRTWREAKLPSEREHVTSYMWTNPDLFKLGNLAHDTDLSHLRWTVDTPEDLEFVRSVYRAFYPEERFAMGDILRLLDSAPELMKINAGTERDEGYLHSLEQDDSQRDTSE